MKRKLNSKFYCPKPGLSELYTEIQNFKKLKFTNEKKRILEKNFENSQPLKKPKLKHGDNDLDHIQRYLFYTC